jgi:hypothetical protein
MCGRINCDCTFQGKNLWGNVQFVNATDIYDFAVEVTTNLADLDIKVKDVGATGIANGCGKWKVVDATGFPNFKVYRYSTPMAQTDFKISISTTELNPGVNKPPSN